MNRPLIVVLCCAASAIALSGLGGCDSGSATTKGVGGSSSDDGVGVGPGATTGTGTTTTGATMTTTTATGPGGTTSSTSSGNPGGTEPLSDCTSATGSIVTASGHQGAWYTYNDMTASGMQTPTVGLPFMMATPGSSGCTYAANTVGSGFMTWGSGMAFDLNNDGVKPKAAFNASAYTGITFMAKAGPTADAAGKSLQVILMDLYSTPEGGKCNPMAADMTQCNDGPLVTVTLTTAWTPFTYKWSDFAQMKYGLPDPGGMVDTSALFAIQFKSGIGANFDTWVDEIAFTK